jgi:GH18 family chitinase
MLLPLLVFLAAVCSCTPDRMGMIVPDPNAKPNSGEVPSGNPFNPEDPGMDQDSTDIPDANPWDSPERQARIGITPIIEIYYTEYTNDGWFPSLEEVRNFTHINVGHVRFKDKVNGTGIEIPAKSISIVEKFVAYKAQYPELKVKFQMGGWGKNADGWSQMARDEAKRKAFVEECVAITEQYGTDGFDIDWEYPTYAAKDGEYVNGADPSDWYNFITLLKEMREAMPDKIISYAASSSGKYTDNVNALQYVDYINVMTYDLGNPPYHNSPLYRSSITKSRSCQEVIDDIFHGQQGIPYQMMNFGIPFYGHGDGYKLATGNYYPASVTYGDLEDIFFNGTCDGMNVTGKNYRVWDDVAKVPYLADALGKMYASYEDIESVNAKVEFLKSRNMLGAMIWEFREDNKEGTLRHAVKHAMDGNPDTPGKYERPDEYVPEKEAPKMGKVEFTKKLQSSDGKWVPELSGLCLSKDGDFLWGCDDNGGLYKINFDGTFSLHWDKSAEMEALAMDPATGTMYIGLESTSNSGYVVSAPGYNSKTNFGWLVDGVANMDNSGVEGIAWYKGELLLGTQTGATLFRYTLDGKLQEKKSLRTVCSNISEIAGLDYDEENDWLWVIDSNSNEDNPQYDPYTIYLFDGAATRLIAKYYIGDFADWNPEAICVDKKNGCIWVGEDCGDEKFSILHKVKFSGM